MSVLTSALGSKVMKWEASTNITLFIGEGEREEAVLVLHIGDSQLMAHRSDGDTTCIGFPCLRSLTGGPWLDFSKPGVSLKQYGPHYSMVRPTNELFFQTLIHNSLVNLKGLKAPVNLLPPLGIVHSSERFNRHNPSHGDAR
jgi:hypothetical protein